MKNIFNSIRLTRPGKNVFDLTHDVKLSLNPGELVPILAMECVPGDKISLSCESLLRFAPLISPVMHRSDVTMHYFFVPNRLTWPNWEKFITNTPVSGMAPAFPTVQLGAGPQPPLADYMGIPTHGLDGFELVSALPFAAYQMIYNEYYRDQNLIEPIDFILQDGQNSTTDLMPLRRRAWEHDYFTSALPFAQKGPAVDIPLGDVTLKDDWAVENKPTFVDENKDNVFPTSNILAGVDEIMADGPVDIPTALDPNGSLEVGATTINDLRRAFKLQEWLEKNARAGTRYIENIFAHFGVRSSDKRLQRPEYITGTKSPVVISEILNTTGTDELPQGNMAGHGVSVTSGKYGKYFCEEHGYIIGIMSVLPKPAYQQGIARHFLKKDFTDFFWPEFAHLGEQEVYNKELYAFTDTGNETFGYVPRYAEYKYMPSRVAGDFRTTLDFWHWGRIFSSQPALNQTFIECDPDPRIFAVTDGDTQKFYCHVLNKIKAVRPMPKFGTPTF